MESVIKKLLFYGIAIMLTGCVPSLHRLYVDDNDLVFDEKLLGDFHSKDPDWLWSFEKGSSKDKEYEMTIIDEDKKPGKFDVHLVKIDEMRFLDLYPADRPDSAESGFYQGHFMPIHTFMKIELSQPNISLNFMDGEKVEKMIENDPNIIKHEFVDKTLVLTASPKELQQFMRDYANDPNVFTKPCELLRITDPNK